MADGIEICAPDDPNRCQGTTAFGQCNKYSLPGTSRCKMHGPKDAHVKKDLLNGYLLTKWQDRLERLSDTTGVRSLRTEIGVLKMTLEMILDKCNNADDIIDNSNKIMALTEKIERVVVSCNRLEKNVGLMLDKSAALQIAGNICTIISNYVEDPEVIEAISGEIISQILAVDVSEDK